MNKQLIENLIQHLQNLNEAEEKILEATSLKLFNTTKNIKNPQDVQNFISKNEHKVDKTLANMKSEHKPIYKRAWSFLCYAAKQTASFIKKHWKKILMLIIIIALAWISYSMFNMLIEKIISFLTAGVKHVDKVGKPMLAPGEYLQQHAIKTGQKPISDGWAHMINQLNSMP